MRKSNRLAVQLLQNVVKSPAKRSRASVSSISDDEEPKQPRSVGKTKAKRSSPKPARKKVKIETKNAESDCSDTQVKVKKTDGKKKVQSKAKQRKKDENDKQYNIGAKIGDQLTIKVAPYNLNAAQRKKLIGAHVSMSGGLCNAVYNAVEIQAKSFALFLRSQRQWKSKPLDENTAKAFRDACTEHAFEPSQILPHGIYLMNCGSPDHETLTKSREVLVEELQRCELLGLTLYNFHPGSTCGKISVEECLDRIAESINIAHSKTTNVITVIENMSCQGNTIGGKFEELHGIIQRVQNKSRIGVCLDTCHTFAAGYDISSKESYEKTMNEFDNIVGFNYLKGVHLNDSKGELGCHLDRHENIGKGKIGQEGFRFFMEDSRFNGIPMILETPFVSQDTYALEIKELYSMVK